jgi:hypothetical protein
MVAQPVAQEIEQLRGDSEPAFFEALPELAYLPDESRVFVLVGTGVHVSEFFKIPFFSPEVASGVIDQAGENPAQRVLPFPEPHRVVQLVDHRDELEMLQVDFRDVEVEAFRPLNERHVVLALMRRARFVGGKLNGARTSALERAGPVFAPNSGRPEAALAI